MILTEAVHYFKTRNLTKTGDIVTIKFTLNTRNSENYLLNVGHTIFVPVFDISIYLLFLVFNV